MNKFLTLLLILMIAPLVGGIYGMLHDQLTYSISPEYYTRFKFLQFGLMESGEEMMLPNPRQGVCIVGFLATWWMGIPIGLILGLVGLIHKNWKSMFIITMKAILVTVVIAFLTSLIGLGYGAFFLIKKPLSEFSNWYIPHNLTDVASFIKVGSMHNFSYLGGLTGLIGGIIYSYSRKHSES